MCSLTFYSSSRCSLLIIDTVELPGSNGILNLLSFAMMLGLAVALDELCQALFIFMDSFQSRRQRTSTSDNQIEYWTTEDSHFETSRDSCHRRNWSSMSNGWGRRQLGKFLPMGCRELWWTMDELLCSIFKLLSCDSCHRRNWSSMSDGWERRPLGKFLPMGCRELWWTMNELLCPIFKLLSRDSCHRRNWSSMSYGWGRRSLDKFLPMGCRELWWTMDELLCPIFKLLS
jgi:hypothetical protein